MDNELKKGTKMREFFFRKYSAKDCQHLVGGV
jgi:hypothetical protein